MRAPKLRAMQRDLLERWLPHIGAVPSAANPFVCTTCLGPVSHRYKQCVGCHQLFHRAPHHLSRTIVPMTAALNPGPWYDALLSYKNARTSHRPLLSALVHHFLASRATHIAALMGGYPTMIAVVPSKRGIPFSQHSLARALALSPAIRPILANALYHDPNAILPHNNYHPGAFPEGPDSPRRHRVLLIEDSWVSGSTAVSAAGALWNYGAASLAILPIARVVDSAWWPESHPYRQLMRAPFDPDASHWPRPIRLNEHRRIAEPSVHT